MENVSSPAETQVVFCALKFNEGHGSVFQGIFPYMHYVNTYISLSAAGQARIAELDLFLPWFRHSYQIHRDETSLLVYIYICVCRLCACHRLQPQSFEITCSLPLFFPCKGAGSWWKGYIDLASCITRTMLEQKTRFTLSMISELSQGCYSAMCTGAVQSLRLLIVLVLQGISILVWHVIAVCVVRFMIIPPFF